MRHPAALLLALCMATAPGFLSARAAEPPLDDVAVRLEPGDVFPYVEPGATGKVSFLFTSKADHDLQLTWKVQITLATSKGPDLEEKIVLPKGGSTRVAMPDVVAARRGVTTFTWQLKDQDGRTLALKDRLGVMTLPGPETSHRSNFRYGWGNGLVHFVASPGEEKVMDVYAQFGIDLIRVGDKWAYSEHRGDASRANANNNYWADAALIVNGAKNAGMDVLYVMWGTPLNLAHKGFSNESNVNEMAAATKTELSLMQRVRPPDPVAWRIRVKDTVNRFKDSVKFWEIWNDEDRYHDGGQHMPNGWVGSTDEYLELLRDASTVIKEIDPALIVLNGGFFTIGKNAKHDLNPDMQQRVTREAQSSFDAYASFDTDPALLLGPLADIRKELKPSKPLWLTRVEQHGAGDNPDELVRRLLSARGCGASAFVWMWALNFDSGYRGILMPMSSWKTKERKSINVHSYFQIMPASCAYVHAIGLLRMLPSHARLETGTAGQWLFVFSDSTQKDPRQVVGFWHDDKLPDATLRLRVGAKATCTLVDLYGNSEPLAVGVDGTVSLTVKRTPAYLVVTNGVAIRVIAHDQAATAQ